MNKVNKLYLCHYGDYTFDLPVVNYDDYEKLDNKFDQINTVLVNIFESVEYIEATAERIDDDNYIALACKIAETSRIILQKIKEVKQDDNRTNPDK